MNRYIVKNAFYLCGVLQDEGAEVDLTDEQFVELIPKDVIGKQVVAARDNADDIEEIKHVGGGYYELPNGERVKGKDEAAAVLATLKEGELNAQIKTGEPAASGTGDAE